MKKSISIIMIFIISLFFSTCLLSKEGISITDLKTEGIVNPLGIDVLQPGLSWLLTSVERGQKQLGYQIIVSSSEAYLANEYGDVWNSGKIESSEQINIIYQGPVLQSGIRYYWKVKVWDKYNNESRWSKAAWWEMGLLSNSDWEGTWIGTTSETVSPLFRKDFTISKKVKKATAYVYGLGWYELHLNGTKIGDQVLTPANTDYSERNLYDSYDVTSCLRDGGNAVGLWLANGYGTTYSKYGWKWNDSKRAILQLNIRFTDGSIMKVITDRSWKTSPSQILSADIYNGEIYDGTQEKTGWDSYGFNDENWENVAIKPAPSGEMQSNMSTPVRVIRVIKPVSATQPIKGIFVFDLGQNIAGWVRIHVKNATKGTRIVIRHAETLNPDGTLNIYTNRNAEATDTYICKGDSQEEIYEPRFTYHGFRYVEIKNFPEIPTPIVVEGCIVHADVGITGNFSCSNNLINKIHSNFQWTMLNNMISIPTDNPVRDERTPCQMDWNCLYEAAIQNFDVQQYFKNWLKSIFNANDIPVWSAGQVLGPWLLYQYFGDKRILESFYSSSKEEVDYCIATATSSKFWEGTFGDWCSSSGDGTYEKSFDEGELVSTSLYYYMTSLCSSIAGILGKKR